MTERRAGFALVDANAFYCSCERLFDPALATRPVLVLSNNDGCAIARTAEVKALGIKMGDPWFRIRRTCEENAVAALSSNYTLYGDISRRVNAVLEGFTPDVEIYSIDESFLGTDGLRIPDRVAWGQAVRQRVAAEVGIPTCVGLGPTKTLAKVANRAAKTMPDLDGVCDFFEPSVRDAILSRFPVEDVWGVGPATERKLKALGCETAADLLALPERQARQALTVVGARIVRELRGDPCHALEHVPPRRKGMAVTRSFGARVTTRAALAQALAFYAQRASEKLRRAGLCTPTLTAFVQTRRYGSGPRYAAQATERFIEPVSDAVALVRATSRLLNRLWRPGLAYAKAGVVLQDLVRGSARQLPLALDHRRQARDTLAAVMDEVNARHGRETVRLAATGIDRRWSVRAERRSPAYTTRWADMPTARA